MEEENKQYEAIRAHMNAERLRVVDMHVDDTIKELFRKIRLMISNVENPKKYQKHQTDVGRIIGGVEKTIFQIGRALENIPVIDDNGGVNQEELRLLKDNFENFRSDFERDKNALLQSDPDQISGIIQEHIDMREWQKSMQARSHDLVRSLQTIISKCADSLGIVDYEGVQSEMRDKISKLTESAIRKKTQEDEERRAKRRVAAHKGQETTRQRLRNEQEATDNHAASRSDTVPHQTKWQSIKEKISEWWRKGVDTVKDGLQKGKTKIMAGGKKVKQLPQTMKQNAKKGYISVNNSAKSIWFQNKPEFIRHRVGKELKIRQRSDREALTKQLTCLAVLLADDEQHKHIPSQLSPGIIATKSKREIRCRISPDIRDGKYGGIMEAIVQMCINERRLKRDRRKRPIVEMVKDILEGAERLATTQSTNANGETIGGKYSDENNLLAAFASVAGDKGQEIAPKIKDFATTLQKEKDTRSETETGGVWGFIKDQAKGIFAYTGLDTFINPLIEKITGLIPDSLQKKKKSEAKKAEKIKNATHLRYGNKPPKR